MKGIILAGGTGSRLLPLTKVTNKHLLPIYNKPMIYYPLQTLVNGGIKDILIVSGPGYAGHFVNLLGSGKEFGVRLSYEIQDEAGGIAQALGLAEDFVNNEVCAVILGDNIFEDNFTQQIKQMEKQKNGAMVFIKRVPDPNRFGVAEIKGETIIGIEEKPKNHESNYAVTGLYIYDHHVFDLIRSLKPSARGELEITDVNNLYIKKGQMKYSIINGFWSDAGTFDSLYMASCLIREKQKRNENVK